MSLYQDENLQKRCKIMVQKEDPQKKPVSPESEPSDLLHLPLPQPLPDSQLCEVGMPLSSAEASTHSPLRPGVQPSTLTARQSEGMVRLPVLTGKLNLALGLLCLRQGSICCDKFLQV